ncbi:MAG TPA: D-2-hydroxyacid dehydrogenase [Caulobacteraceae bacterium]
MTRVLIYEPTYRRLEAKFAALGVTFDPVLVNDAGEITVTGQASTAEEAHPEAVWANHEVFVSPAVRPFMVTMLKSPALKWVQSAAAGFDNPVFGQIIQKGAKLSTSHGQALGMAEYVLAGVIDHFQHGPERRAAQAEKAWRRLAFREILDSEWLVIGFGAIGQAVAQRAKGFGARITGVRRNQAPHDLADNIAPMSAIPDLLPHADVVVLCTPLTVETRHLVDAAFLSAMKPGSVIVNVGRGGLVDEPALLAALDAGKPEHAVLDVFETEPLPEDSPFWNHPRVALTPHASGITSGQWTRNETLFLDNLKRYLAGEPLLNVADPKDVLAG